MSSFRAARFKPTHVIHFSDEWNNYNMAVQIEAENGQSAAWGEDGEYVAEQKGATGNWRILDERLKVDYDYTVTKVIPIDTSC